MITYGLPRWDSPDEIAYLETDARELGEAVYQPTPQDWAEYEADLATDEANRIQLALLAESKLHDAECFGASCDEEIPW